MCEEIGQNSNKNWRMPQMQMVREEDRIVQEENTHQRFEILNFGEMEVIYFTRYF